MKQSSRQTIHTDDQDVREAVERIASQFYSSETPDLEIGKHSSGYDSADRNISHSSDGTPPMERYLDFSDSHQHSNQLVLGVILLFTLIFSVWGVVWYYSVEHLAATNTSLLDMSILNQTTDEFSALLETLEEAQVAKNEMTQEAVLKSELSTIISHDQLPAVLGVTTTTSSTMLETSNTSTIE